MLNHEPARSVDWCGKEIWVVAGNASTAVIVTYTSKRNVPWSSCNTVHSQASTDHGTVFSIHLFRVKLYGLRNCGPRWLLQLYYSKVVQYYLVLWRYLGPASTNNRMCISLQNMLLAWYFALQLQL